MNEGTPLGVKSTISRYGYSAVNGPHSRTLLFFSTVIGDSYSFRHRAFNARHKERGARTYRISPKLSVTHNFSVLITTAGHCKFIIKVWPPPVWGRECHFLKNPDQLWCPLCISSNEYQMLFLQGKRDKMQSWPPTMQVAMPLLLCIHDIMLNYTPTMPAKRLRWSRGCVLAFSTQVCGFKPGRSRRNFQGEKILSTASFGGEVKPSAPCHRFAACKRSLK
jgi:hypothetical protein